MNENIPISRLDLILPSGKRAIALVSRPVLGVAVNQSACLAHRSWMTITELRHLSECAAALADDLEQWGVA